MKYILTFLLLTMTSCSPPTSQPDHIDQWVESTFDLNNREELVVIPITLDSIRDQFSEEKICILEKANTISHFSVPNLPIGNQYSLYSVTLLKNVKFLGRLVVGSEHYLYRETHNKPYIFRCNNFHQGEPLFFLLVADDGQTYASKHICRPLKTEWEDGASIEIYMRTLENFSIEIIGKGFEPDEEIKIEMKDWEHLHEFGIKTGPEGIFSQELKYVLMGHFKFIRHDSHKTRTITLPLQLRIPLGLVQEHIRTLDTNKMLY